MQIQKLILDTNYFVNRNEKVLANQYFVTDAVIKEVKDDDSKVYMDQFIASHNV